MPNDWLDLLLGSEIDIRVPQLMLKQPGVLFQGSGQITCSARTGIRAQAVTDGAEIIQRKLFPLVYTPGEIVPQTYHFSTEGRTQDGWSLELPPQAINDYKTDYNSPYVLWDFKSWFLRLSKELPSSGGSRRRIKALLGPSLETWVRQTRTVIENQRLKRIDVRTDWLEFGTTIGAMVARKRTDDWFEVELDPHPNANDTDVLELLAPVAHAFGFLLGKRVAILGYTEHCPNREVRYAQDFPKPTINALPGPLGCGARPASRIETALPLLVEFFLTARGQSAAHYLSLCADVADNVLTTRIAVAGICLEGIIKLAAKNHKQDAESCSPEDRAALDLWLNGNTNLNERFVARVRGFLGSLSHPRPIDVLRDWRARSVLGVEELDVQAWTKTRNRTAHGTLLGLSSMAPDLQAVLDDFYRVLNLINRVILQMIGYRGPYQDYGQKGWPAVEFPAAEGDGL